MRISEHSRVAHIETASAPTKPVNKRSARNFATYDETKTPQFPEDGKGKLHDCDKTQAKLVGNPNHGRQ